MTCTMPRYGTTMHRVPTPREEIGEDHRPETHLIPLVLQTALQQREQVFVFGDDYPTPDGTCIRDFIHISDLAQAHLLALEKLAVDRDNCIYNLGNGEGYSVRTVIDLAGEVTGRPLAIQTVGRRSGDPAILVGDAAKARAELGWQPRFAKLGDIIETAWNWHRGHPHGYETS